MGIPLKLLLTFNKVASMLSEIIDPESSDVVKVAELEKALSYVESNEIKLSDCKSKVTRRNEFMPSSSSDIDGRTIYAENLPPDADHDFIRSVFVPYGEVVYVSMPKFKSGRSKGFAFIEFKAAESVDKVVAELTNVTVFKGDNLASVKTFNEDKEEAEVKQQSAMVIKSECNIGNKRKHEEGGKQVVKRVKIQEEVNVEKNFEGFTSTDGGVQPICSGTEIQVLSKVTWKKLRNKYLDEQRKNIGALKQNLKKNKPPRFTEKKQTIEKKENLIKEVVKDSVDIKPGVVVKIILEEDINNVQDFKKDIKSALEGEKVSYVDAKIGYSIAFVRCEDENQAKKLEKSTLINAVEKNILQGQEEKDYHVKVAKDRLEKRSGKIKVTKTKTKTKVIQRFENVKNSHVYFD